MFKADKEEWYGVDSQQSGFEIDSVLYEQTKKFFRDYLNQDASDDHFAEDAYVDLIDVEVMAIRGSRYGCT